MCSYSLTTCFEKHQENKVVYLPDSPITLITFLSLLSDVSNKNRASLILLRPNLTDFLNNL